MKRQNIFLMIYVLVSLSLLPFTAQSNSQGTSENHITHSHERHPTKEVHIDRSDPNILIYVPDELLVKFSNTASNLLEAGLKTDVTVEQILSGSALDNLSQKYHVSRIEPIFKDFKFPELFF